MKKFHCTGLHHTMAIAAGALLYPIIAASADTNNASQTVCLNTTTNEERRIELVYQNPDSPIPCSLFYDKAGAREEVASAKNSTGHCEKVERKMVRNLVKAGWSCEHRFLGALDAHDRKEITLNLFTADRSDNDDSFRAADSSADAAAKSDGSQEIVEPVIERNPETSSTVSPVATTDPDINLSATQIATDLKATLEQQYVSELQDQLEQAFSDELGPEYVASVTIQLTLNVEVSPARQSGINEEESPITATDEIASPETSPTTAALRVSTAGNAPISDSDGVTIGGYTLASQAFDNERDAHRFASEFHGVYPGVQSRVAQFDDASAWRLVLGTNDNQATLDDGRLQLDADTQRYFEVLDTGVIATAGSDLEWVPDDWARYAVASCYAKGNTTSLELADCAGVVLDVDSFLSCLAGGICVPEQVSADLTPQQIDFLAVVGSEDPVAAARGILINKIQGCEQLRVPGSEEAAECVALSILDEDQRDLYDCYQRAGEQRDLIDCMGNETLSENVLLYERCSVDNLAMTECVMAEVNNEHLNSAARCVNYGDADAILTCAIDANIDTDESRVLACITDSSVRSDQAQCLSREYLDEEQAALLNCTRDDYRSESNFGLCIANQRGILSGDEYRAAECLLTGETEPSGLLNCAGARFASNEVNQCLDANVPLSDCFSTDTIISEVVANQVDDLLDVQSIDNQIAMFRADLYALEGGDLSQILSNEASSEIFATTEEVANEVKKKSKGLFRKFGFGK